jgi:hypothetical protein
MRAHLITTQAGNEEGYGDEGIELASIGDSSDADQLAKSTESDLDMVLDIGYGGNNNPGHLSHGADLTVGSNFGSFGVSHDTPTNNPNYPCGEVYKNIWYFRAPVTGDLSDIYNGRLQFSLFTSSHSGSARKSRGAVQVEGVVLDAGGIEQTVTLSYSLAGFPLPNNQTWTTFVVVFREDFGWVEEPRGIPANFSFLYSTLSNVKEVRIRGDNWVYSDKGYGTDVTYINNIKMLEP